MKKVTKTHQDLVNLVNTISLNVEGQTTKVQKKLFKIYEKLKPHVEEFNEGIQELRLDNASVDDKKNLILTEKGDYTFTKDATKEFNKQSKEFSRKDKEFDVIDIVNPIGLESYIFLKDWVSGVVFDVEPEEEGL